MQAVLSQVEELEDYAELEGLIAPDELPKPELSRCFVSRNSNGKIDGYCFIQTIVVVEPIWVSPERRSRGTALKLFDAAVSALMADGSASAFVCHALTPEVEGYLKRLGMKDVGRTFVGEVR